MPVTVEIRDAAPSAAVFDAVFSDLTRVDRMFSPFLTESAVSRINARTLREADADPLVAEVLARCRDHEVLTYGYFNAWSGGRLDPSGFVKGWAIARACAILDRHGHRNYFVDGAGDVQTRGEREPGVAWRVGIRHPVERSKVARVVLARDLAVATSGTYEKGSHIQDPHTGLPATALVSLTVTGPDIVTADVFATAAFAMGLAGLPFIEARPGYEAYAIDPALRARWTSGFEALCAPEMGGGADR